MVLRVAAESDHRENLMKNIEDLHKSSADLVTLERTHFSKKEKVMRSESVLAEEILTTVGEALSYIAAPRRPWDKSGPRVVSLNLYCCIEVTPTLRYAYTESDDGDRASALWLYGYEPGVYPMGIDEIISKLIVKFESVINGRLPKITKAMEVENAKLIRAYTLLQAVRGITI
jgi:hypothetical protein